jgi:hypothetical protein
MWFFNGQGFGGIMSAGNELIASSDYIKHHLLPEGVSVVIL